jgi:hypothetical protein
MGKLWVVLGLTLAALGCDRTWRPLAAASLMCPEHKLEKAHLDWSVLVTGCGRTDVLWTERPNEWSSLRARAAFEMPCDTSAIEITVLSPSVYGATGCNKRMVYKDMPAVGIRLESSQSGPAAP